MKINRLLFACVTLVATPLLANDWTNWRGPESNGVSRETGLPADIEDVLWMKKDVSCRDDSHRDE